MRRRIKKISRNIRKKISEGLRKYYRQVKRIKKRLGVETTYAARLAYRRQYIMIRTRFERKSYKKFSDIPKNQREFAKQIGKRKKVWVVYIDTLHRRPISGKTALRMRRMFFEERLANRLLEISWKRIGKIIGKHWPKRAQKRGFLTLWEARKVSKKILRLKRTDRQLALRIRQVMYL